METPLAQENRFRPKKRSKWFWALVVTAGVVVCAGTLFMTLGAAVENTSRNAKKTRLAEVLEDNRPYYSATLLEDAEHIHDDELMLLCKFLTEEDDRRHSGADWLLLKALRHSLNSVKYKGSGLKPFVSMALQKGNAELLEVLCSSDCYKGEDFNRAIVFAIDKDNMKLLKELATKSFSGKNVDKTLVKYALEKNKPLMALELTNSGAAFEGNEKDILFRAIELRPDMWPHLAFEQRQTVCDHAGEFFLHAAKYGRTEIIKRLIDPRNKDKNILIAAGEESDGEDSGIGPWPEVDLNSHGVDALFVCLESEKYWDVVSLLLDAGADVNAISRDAEKQTLLHAYVRDFSSPDHGEEFVRYLLEKGINVNAKDASGLTALHIALARNYLADEREEKAKVEKLPSVAALLIQNGADVNARTSSGLTPMMIAAWVGAHQDVFHLLRQKGADVNARDDFGFTPLMWATVRRRYDSMQALLAANADVNAKTSSGATALYFALQNCDDKAVRILLAADAEADRTTIDAVTRESCYIACAVIHADILRIPQIMRNADVYRMIKGHIFPSEKKAKESEEK
ncbi:MAG: ankyrin repeat domain-containing protein [Akkermansia sp.]|nr:ankyrin repeat domain-containing protein [Akkermansia sp.]